MESWSVLRFSTYSPTYVLRTHAAKLSNMTLQVPQIYEYLNRGVRRNTRSTTTLLPLICEVYNIASKMLHCFINPIIHSREIIDVFQNYSITSSFFGWFNSWHQNIAGSQECLQRRMGINPRWRRLFTEAAILLVSTTISTETRGLDDDDWIGLNQN